MAVTFGNPYDAQNKCRVFVFSVGNEWRKHSAPYDARNKCRVFVFSVGNEWRKHSAPYDAKHKCRVFVLLASEMNGGNDSAPYDPISLRSYA